jgi:hypothetical protein
MRWTFGTTMDDHYAVFDGDAEIARFDDERAPGCAEPNFSRGAAVLDAMRLAELIATEEPESLRGLAASDILRRAGLR